MTGIGTWIVKRSMIDKLSNALKLIQNNHRGTGNIFKCTLLYENHSISSQISLKTVA